MSVLRFAPLKMRLKAESQVTIPGPEKRWADEFQKFSKDWRDLAADEKSWLSLEDKFLKDVGVN